MKTRRTKSTLATFHESTYGDYIITSKIPPSLKAGEIIEVSGTKYNDGQYEVCLVEKNRIVVCPDTGLVGENSENCALRRIPIK